MPTPAEFPTIWTNMQRCGFKSLVFAALIVTVTLLNGCAGSGKKETTQVLIPDDAWWVAAQNSPETPTGNLARVRGRLAKVVPLKYSLGLSKQTEINAYASKQDGQTLVVFTDGFLQSFGNDPDVLATTLGHELAHHQLGHTDPGRQKSRAATQEIASQVLGTIAGYFIPFSGLVVGPAVKAATLTFNRDDERDADALGMTWAWQAGYSPCGSYRLAKKLSDMGEGAALAFLSTHPGNAERMENAEEFAATHGLPPCGKAP